MEELKKINDCKYLKCESERREFVGGDYEIIEKCICMLAENNPKIKDDLYDDFLNKGLAGSLYDPSLPLECPIIDYIESGKSKEFWYKCKYYEPLENEE